MDKKVIKRLPIDNDCKGMCQAITDEINARRAGKATVASGNMLARLAFVWLANYRQHIETELPRNHIDVRPTSVEYDE